MPLELTRVARPARAQLLPRAGSSTGARSSTVVPITHTAPNDPAGDRDIGRLKDHLGLDDLPSWIVITEPMTSSGLAPTSAPSRKMARISPMAYCLPDFRASTQPHPSGKPLALCRRGLSTSLTVSKADKSGDDSTDGRSADGNNKAGSMAGRTGDSTVDDRTGDSSIEQAELAQSLELSFPPSQKPFLRPAACKLATPRISVSEAASPNQASVYGEDIMPRLHLEASAFGISLRMFAPTT